MRAQRVRRLKRGLSLWRSCFRRVAPSNSSEEVLNSQLIQRLQEREGALRAQIAELSTTLLPTHPRIRALQGQVASLDEQIHEEVAKVLKSLRTAARVAAAREESLVKSLNEAKGVVSQSNDQNIELRALQREAAAQRELLESFLTRYREASARTDANYLPADARIISRAVPPITPSFPKKTMMAVAAALAMLLLSSTVVLLAEFTSGRAFRVIGYGEPSEPPRPLQPAAIADTLPTYPGPVERAAVEASQTDAAPADEPVLPPSRPPTVAERPEVDEVKQVGEVKVVPAAVPVEPAAREPHHHATAISEMAHTTELLDQAPHPSEEIETEEPTPVTTTAIEPRRPRREVIEAKSKPDSEMEEVAAEPATSDTGGLGEILANTSVRVALFAGAEGGEGAGAIAFTAARQAAKQKVRCVIVDVGRLASDALGHERPGLADLLAGDASFGEVIQRDDTARVHVIPLGDLVKDMPMQRMRLVVGALTHTYDKVILVADKVDDWPDEYVQPDIAAIVCGADTTESLRTEIYDFVLARGAHSAVIVRYSDFDLGDHEKSAAA